MIKPWEPRAIVLRFFPNDVTFGYSPCEIVYLLSLFCNRAKADFSGVKLYLCNDMPHQKTINNLTWQAAAKQYNKLLKEYCDSQEDCYFISQSGWHGFYENVEDIGDYSKVR